MKHPDSLDGIIGQPNLAIVRAWLKRPTARSWLFSGSPGVGKSASAAALANDVGAAQFCTTVLPASELTIDTCRQLERATRTKPMFGQWHIVTIEEMEAVHPTVEKLLKVWLDPSDMPPALIVVATSNDAEAIPDALRQRFTSIAFNSGKQLAGAFLTELHKRWDEATGGAVRPWNLNQFGWDSERKVFSARLALRALEDVILLWQAEQDSNQREAA